MQDIMIARQYTSNAAINYNFKYIPIIPFHCDQATTLVLSITPHDRHLKRDWGNLVVSEIE